ncbi:TPA: hypothetical protein HH295_04695 [Xanthomonas vasicola pv. zeae]|uniref:Uncharacterized protein n=2 Tax=Xanthomonas vasicola TaxID=56459 RepID=A0AAE8F8X4_XANVA|nr:hypothetical protein C7V42_19325 [Xanthomonas vasicola pv. vasculorum]AZR28331.1 hypothetical protein NX80_019825 [Xanthomonas vasicola pv. arecae]AZR32583.1 hypothetical protein KWO_020895 [Xanthomonas vasicola pv. musacearum NCPPB 4379]AZR36297.1 hypothetical protein NX08_019535 [Xanthomonas vasicola]MBV6741145.1 hypothetical protein [Xanthomonas vasicola pv. musacearum NCPPB 2251]MBV6746404.1 hypothetical protein [Xanthomonas vasicola pv. vasculorum NCPPB 890]MBV7277841.1 hypothetical p
MGLHPHLASPRKQQNAYRGNTMPSLICDLEDLLASWKAEARTFDACDMPASALAFRDCHRRLSALVSEHTAQTLPPVEHIVASHQQNAQP